MKRRLHLVLLTLACVAALVCRADGSSPVLVPPRVAAKLPDLAELILPSPLPAGTPAGKGSDAHLVGTGHQAIWLGGFLGERVLVNERNRLLEVDPGPLLAGFQHKPGVHPWIGEHVGKWMHAATLAWVYSGDAKLRAKIDRVAAALIAAQEPDGYLGTYVPAKRFGLYLEADWDVWSHKYNLMGLLTYYQFTGNAAALTASRKMGDLLVRTFGPGRKSILSAGTHMGMAATSVLEPMVLLYRFTGDEHYLEFARYLVRSWDEPQGPRIVAALTTVKAVNRTANGKAYEMLSNLVGLCELARATGDRELLEPVLNAWQDIVEHRLYLTGSASQGEHFHADYELPNRMGANVAETCVTITWIQLNSQLLRLTGQARFGHELERTFYNHLAAAQRPDGAQWCYFTSLEGTKPYGPGINCCVSSGPRGMALVPYHAWLKFRAAGREGLAANLFEPSEVAVALNGQPVLVQQTSGFPRTGNSTLTLHLKPTTFALRLRSPDWARPLRVHVNDAEVQLSTTEDGWAEIPARRWRDGDRVTIDYTLGPRLLAGDHGNAGRQALAWGPFVLAYDQKRNPELPASGSLALAVNPNAPPFHLGSEDSLNFVSAVTVGRQADTRPATFVPFADAGRDGGFYRVWLRAPGTALPLNQSLLADGREERSREGNVSGSIIDGDTDSLVVTFDGRPAAEDWFGVTLGSPVTISRVVFAHGRNFHDGGWFDTAAGKPRLQVQRAQGGPWETVGELSTYPATTGTDSGGLKPGQTFEQRLAQPVKAFGLRVVGKPAGGDNPAQAFVSCAELQAFE